MAKFKTQLYSGNIVIKRDYSATQKLVKKWLKKKNNHLQNLSTIVLDVDSIVLKSLELMSALMILTDGEKTECCLVFLRI